MVKERGCCDSRASGVSRGLRQVEGWLRLPQGGGHTAGPGRFTRQGKHTSYTRVIHCEALCGGSGSAQDSQCFSFMIFPPTHNDRGVDAGQLWWSAAGEDFVGQERADIRLGLGVLGEGFAGVVVFSVFLHGQLFTVPAPRRRTAAVGQGYQLAAHCPHWATHMHGHVMEVEMVLSIKE